MPQVNSRVSTEFPWESRWGYLARAVGLAPEDPVVVALSGGADSVLLLHLVARFQPRARVTAVHVEHGLRGAESAADAEFCAALCTRLGVPLVRRRHALDPEAPNLEALAREGRYRVLAEEAQRLGTGAILTGHHEDDALETLLMRWMRGSALPGLAGLKACNVLATGGGPQVAVYRPLLTMRREEVRRLLADHGLAWREDSSNRSARFTRNRVRHGLLPQIEEVCGPEGLEHLRSFASVVERLEGELAARTAHLAWSPPLHAPARRSSREALVGGTIERSALADLAPALQRRALWRLLSEGTGRAPSRALLALLQSDLAEGRKTRRTLPGNWMLQLRARELHLLPPRSMTPDAELDPAPGSSAQLLLPYSDHAQPAARHQTSVTAGLALGVPGLASLPDGRAIQAEIVAVSPSRSVPRRADEVELDSEDLRGELSVRWARPGDRFHGIGAPGSRPLKRFLADAGIPREDRARVPLVFSGDELIWVAGVRPCERLRVRSRTAHRLRLRLLGAAPSVAPRPSLTDSLYG
ncbi:MAG: tRNA lysidine(34) synthetase TilS [Planctomycetota bacterium]|nr:MAG: tRNA lysidine(34) synthetase TilS [Planctomycetota bacterium]